MWKVQCSSNQACMPAETSWNYSKMFLEYTFNVTKYSQRTSKVQ